MDEGFCVIEMIFDGADHPTDYRFLEVNPAFEKQCGRHHQQADDDRDHEGERAPFVEPEGPGRVTDQGSSSDSGWGLLRVLRMRTKSCARASAFHRSGKKSWATTCFDGS